MTKSETTAAIQDVLRAFSGVIGVEAKHMKTGEVIAINEHEVFPSASLIKLLPLVELYRQASEGRLSLTERLTVLQRQRVGGSGVLKELDPCGPPKSRPHRRAC